MKSIAIVLLLGLGVVPREASAADKLVGIYAARVMSQSSPWIAQEAGLFAKHALSFELKFVASSAMVTAAMLSGEAEVGRGLRPPSHHDGLRVDPKGSEEKRLLDAMLLAVPR